MLPLKKNPIMHKTLALYCSLWFLKKIWFLLPYIHPISNLELRLRGNKSFAAGEGRDPCTKLTPLHRQEGATCYFELPALIVTTMHLRNLTEEVSGQGQWHHMHCPRCNVPIYPHSYFPWKYPWYMWESVDIVLDLCMSVPANWSFMCSQSCDMSIAKAAWHPWVSPLYHVLKLTCNNQGVWHGEVFHYRATMKMLIGMLKW